VIRLTFEQQQALKFGTQFVNLRVRDLRELTGRSEYVCQRTFRQLCISRTVRFGDRKGEVEHGLGLFYSLPNPLNPFEQVFFPTQKGWDEALARGFVKHTVNVTDEKSEGQLAHDLVLTDFHKALHALFGERLQWSQLYKSRYHRWAKGKEDYVNADAFFFIKFPSGKIAAFFVEVENQKGTQEPLRKMGGYLRFAEGPFQDIFKWDDFRVIFLRPSYEMVLNLLHAANAEKTTATRRFWLTDYKAALRPQHKTYYTPKDFETRTWGFQDLA